MDSRGARGLARSVALISTLLFLAIASDAGAATGSLSFLQEQVSTGVTGTLNGARGVAVSPDGKSVYVAGQDSDAVTAYSRGAGGALTSIGCFKDTGAASSCTATEGLNSPRFVAVSPDNKHVYVTGGDDGAVVMFQRDLNTGALSSPNCYSGSGSPASCASSISVPLNGAEGIAVAPDGGQVYVAVQDNSAVVALARNTGNGALALGPSCHTLAATAGCTTTAGIQHPRELAVSPDGKGVYVASASSNVVKAFARNTATGALTDAGSGGEVSLPVGVTVSPDSAHVYAGAVTSAAVRVYTRDPNTSALTAAGCIKDTGSPTAGCTIAEGLLGVEGVAVSPDGFNLYAAGHADHAVAAATRAPASGALGVLECHRDTPGGLGCGSAAGLGGARGVAVSPDGLNVYVTGFNDDTVVTFQRTPSSGGGPAPFNPPRPNPNCTNPVTLLVTCAEPNGLPGVCGPTASILPQCNYPTVLPTICGPSNTLLTACVPPNNYIAACGGTGTVLPVCAFPPPQLPQVCGPTGTLLPACTGGNNPVLFCGGSGTALPPCNLPPGAIQGTVAPSGGEVEVTVGCPRANASGRSQTCTIDAIIADRRRALRSSLYSYVERWAVAIVRSNLSAAGLSAQQWERVRLDDSAAMIRRGADMLDKAFQAAEAGDPFRRSTAISTLTSLGGPPRLTGSYPSIASFQADAAELVDKVIHVMDGYKYFLDYQRSPTARSTATAAAATGLVKPLARKRVKVKVGKRKRVTVKLSKRAVKQLRKGVKKRKAVAIRLLVTYKSKPRPVVRMVDFPIKVAKPKASKPKGKGKAKRGKPKSKRR